jgi:hypothetical protein
MRTNQNNHRIIIRFALVIIIISSLLAGSCSSRKNKTDRSNLIPEKDLVPILTELYIADGLLTLTKVRYWFTPIDSVSTYFYIIEKHGYTKETMDKTMKYYFIKNPKRLIKIYDKVLSILSEMESLNDKELFQTQGRVPNLWTAREYYSFPNLSGTDSAKFDINRLGPGIYTLKFTATLFPDDQSLNTRLSLYTCHPDSIYSGKRKYYDTFNYIKDGQPHIYTLIVTVPKNTTSRLRGSFYESDNYFDEWGKHVIIENISINLISALL